jgi:8-oxo-dGTP diphosphatase
MLDIQWIFQIVNALFPPAYFVLFAKEYNNGMAHRNRVILTNMCMLYDSEGRFLVQMRQKQDWPGLNFPGGHVEDEESIPSSVIREMKEETGLTVSDLEEVGYFEWNVPQEGVRHLTILFRSCHYSGTLQSSSEGPVFWIRREEVENYPLSTDFVALLEKMRSGLK